MKMLLNSRPKILVLAVIHTLQVYGAALIFSFIVLVCFPWWLRWCFFAGCGTIFLMNLLVPIIEYCMPKKRVHSGGKAVFITGCDSGFGHLLAQRLDDIGLQVFAGCLFPTGEGAQALKQSASNNLHVVPLDVTSDESIEGALKYVTENLKDNKMWGVVNNAGIAEGGEIFWTNNDIIKRVMDVNIFGVVKVTKAFLPLLVKFKGRIVNVSSAAGRYSCGGLVPYCVSKHAVISFSDGLRQEMYRFGVKVITIEPFFYKTNICSEESVTKSLNKTWNSAPEEVKQFHSEDYPQRCLKVAMKAINASPSSNLHEVIDCMENALMLVTPKYSYSPGTLSSKVVLWFGSRLAKPFADAILHDACSIPID